MDNRPTQDVWGRPIWYPDQKPYRVLAYYRSGASYHHGWTTGRPQTFATEAEARNAVDAIPRRGLIDICIHYAVNAETWNRNGKWRLVERITPTNSTCTN